MTKGQAGRVAGWEQQAGGQAQAPTPGPGYAQLPQCLLTLGQAHHVSAAKGSRELHPDTANFSSSLMAAAGTSLQGREFFQQT